MQAVALERGSWRAQGVLRRGGVAATALSHRGLSGGAEVHAVRHVCEVRDEARARGA